jgi:hypothetical protein
MDTTTMKNPKECECGGYCNMSGWNSVIKRYIYTCDKCGKKITISYIPSEKNEPTPENL